MTLSKFKEYLTQHFPGKKIYIGAIDKRQPECIGIYTRGGATTPFLAVGGLVNTSFGTLPITLLIHWGENTAVAEQVSQAVYEKLFGVSNIEIDGERIIAFQVIDPCPIDVGRDERNIVEYTIRLNIVYERKG